MNTVIFDLGGVLIDWNPRPALRARLQDKGLPGSDADIEAFLKGPFKKLHWLAHDSKAPFTESLGPHLKSQNEHAHFIEVMIEKWDDFVREPIAGTVTLLDRLAQTKTRLYGLSNWPAQTWPPGGHQRAQDFGFLNHFADIIVSGEVGLRKPDPAIFHLARERFAVDPQETLFVDDLEENIRVARELGFAAHLFETPQGLEKDLIARGFLKQS